MNPEKLKCVIDLGSININCIIGQITDDSTIKVLSTSSVKSKGIHNGNIINLKDATKAIRRCLSNAEKKLDIVLKKITVVLEMPELNCTRLSKYRKFDGSKIYKEDIDFLLKEGKKEVSLNDSKKSIIHIFNHNYIVDEKEFIQEPINVHADFLKHEMTFITIPKNIIKNINQIFIDCELEVERFISKTFALAAYYFNDTELKLGTTLIDIGFEKTSLGIFNKFALINLKSFPIGINHITKDISRLCSLSVEESENIRDEIGCIFLKPEKENTLPEKFFKNSKFRKISMSLITEIIIARTKDILDIANKEINISDLKMTSGKNIFITGGGSKLQYLREFCEKFFSTNIRILNNSSSSSDYTESKNHVPDSCFGALKIIFQGWETEAIPENVDKKNKKWRFFSNILGN